MRLSKHGFAVAGLGYLPPWCVNAGFIAGGATTLIVDTGANSLAAATIHGYAQAAVPSNRLAILNTEHHFDHIGGNSYFRKLGLDIYGHKDLRRTDADFEAEIADFNNQIPNQIRRLHREAEAFYHATELANPNLPIADDTRMDLGDCGIEILLTPGHTPTNISVWVPREGVLYCGDCLVNRYLPNLDAGSKADWKDWLQSLDRIAKLAPAIVMPGHGPVAQGDEVPRLIDSVRVILEQAIARGFSPTSRVASA